MKLYEHQLEAVKNMKNGCILCGGVGSGKSLTSIAYYYLQNGGDIDFLNGGELIPMNDPPMDLYIITTAHKRDTCEWDKELGYFLMSKNSTDSWNIYGNKVVVDSWNNIAKYIGIKDAFFIFDEQRVVGKGTWVKSFLKIAKNNKWILLSATPGDDWPDYIPVFIANGFYKSRKEFNYNHVVFSPYVRYEKVERYLNLGRLIRLRKSILVDMDFYRHTIPHHEKIYCDYDKIEYKQMIKLRWNPWEEKPMKTASELCYSLRKLVNSDETRIVKLLEILERTPKAIIFYNFDYELDILKDALSNWNDNEIAEWNGHKHQPLPSSGRWVYLVQYTAGAEGWNCVTTDTIIFFSQNYSYKIVAQAAGRIDRLNTPFTDLYYYHLTSRSGIDLGISRTLDKKKKFNEGKWVSQFG